MLHLLSLLFLLQNPWVTDPVSATDVTHVIFHSDAVGDEVSFHIYLPPAYQENPDDRHPVLYWLHGSGGGLPGIPTLRNYFHYHIGNGNIPPMIVVFPWGLPQGMWVDSKSGQQPVESMLMEDLIPFVDNGYRTIAEPKGRLLEGFSMGGYGAARLGLTYYDRFAGFSMLGAGPLQLDFVNYPHARTSPEQRQQIFDEVYGGDQKYFEAMSPWRIAEVAADKLPDGYMMRQVIGLDDELLIMNRELHVHWTDLGLNWQYLEVPDVGHVTAPLLGHLAQHGELDFYQSVFGTSTSAEPEEVDPSAPELFHNYPNPFNPETTIRYQVAEAGPVTLNVHDITGRLITTLVDVQQLPGTYSVSFHPGELASGPYFLKMTTASHTQTRKMMLVK